MEVTKGVELAWGEFVTNALPAELYGLETNLYCIFGELL